MFLDYDVGKLIFLLRSEKKISQEKLAENICMASNISRYENGSQVPKRETLQLILEKLGGPGFFHTYYLEPAFYSEMLVRRNLLEAFEYEKYDEVTDLLHELSQIYDEKNPYSSQFFQFMKLLYFLHLDHKEEGLIDKCVKLMKLTYNAFELDMDYDALIPSNTECIILNFIAILLLRNNETDRAQKILCKLLKNLIKSEHFLPQYWKARAVILNNIALCKIQEELYNEAALIMDEATLCGLREGGGLFFFKLMRTKLETYSDSTYMYDQRKTEEYIIRIGLFFFSKWFGKKIGVTAFLERPKELLFF